MTASGCASVVPAAPEPQGGAAYRQGILAGAPDHLALPFDRRRPAACSGRIAVATSGIAEPGALALQWLARSHDATLQMVLIAGWQCLLAQWSGQTDFLVASLSRRDRGQGPRTGHAVLRANLTDDPSYLDVLAQVKAALSEAEQHWRGPGETCRGEQPPPACRTRVVMEGGPDSAHVFADVDGWSPEDFDLSLVAQESPKCLALRLEYLVDLFEPESIEALAEQLATLLAGVAEDPGRPVSRLVLLSAREEEELRVLWREVDPAPPPRLCLHEMLEVRARAAPDSVALAFGALRLTYGELDRRAERLARHLVARGARPGTLIGLCVERSFETVIGILAILKAGGAYLPLDPASPPDRIAFILEDADAPLLVTQNGLSERLPATDATILSLDRLDEEEPPSVPLPEAAPGDLAYCIYTSGSTGKPKGVLVSHANVTRLLATTRRHFDFRETDIWTLFHSCAFDFSVWEIFGCLAHGGRLVVVPQLVAQSPDQFFDLLDRESVTVLNMTPSAFRQLIAASEGRPLLGALRYVIFGGEAMHPASLSGWTDRYGWDRPALINMYGITETTVHVTYCRLRPDDARFPGRSPIGRPLDDLGITLLDPDMVPVPRGIPGEIYVRGAGVSGGYLNRPQLTAERFLVDRWGGGGRLYRTGDLARQGHDGQLEYLGRADQQVKLRGYRIELGEIEACLAALEPVAEASVALVGDAPEEKRIVAWVTPKAGQRLDPERLRLEASKTLPGFMLPARLIPVPALPLNGNGKIDRARLLAMMDDIRPGRDDFVSPRPGREAELAAIWERVLEVRPIGASDNFFASGGDSIRALQVVRAAEERGLFFTLGELVGSADLANLAARARSGKVSRSGEASARRGGAATDDDSRPYPLSAMQALMVDAYGGNSSHGIGLYHSQQALRIRSRDPSAAALRQALRCVMAAHPVLRTGFRRNSTGEMVQIVQPEVVADCREVESSGPGDEGLLRMMLDDRRESFRQEEPGEALIRLRMLRRSEQEFDLLVSSHHAIEDGWGSQQFLAELFAAYQDIRAGRSVRIEAKPNVFRDFVALEARRAAAPETAVFWRDHGARALLSLPPLAPPRPVPAEPEAFERFIALPAAAVANVRQAARSRRVSTKAVLLCIFNAALREVLDWEQPVVGVVANGRTTDLPDPLTALGMFWSLVPFAAPPSPAGAAGFEETMNLLTVLESRATALGAFLHAPIASGEAFSVTFNFIELHNSPVRSASEALSARFVLGFDKFHYPLNALFAIDPVDGGLTLHFEYNHRLVDPAVVRALETRIQHNLMTLGEDE